MRKNKERHFESYLEETLLSRGWEAGDKAEWDKANALFPPRVFAFIERSQQALWQSMLAQHGKTFPEKLLADLLSELHIKGSLHVLRHGFKCYGKLFKLAYFKPAHSLNPDALALYAHNQLTITRQIPCHPSDNSTVDMLFAVNGIPVATCELKNPLSGQTWQHAVNQYKNDRNPNVPLFAFKRRALVHFAADTEEVHMTTRINGGKTFFLPFNKGSAPGELICGKGNPQHASGYRTGYFWEEVLERESFLNILARYMFLEVDEKKELGTDGKMHLKKSETMIFPRYHQLDATRKLIDASKAQGPGNSYLIQHSAGSGKTKSIAWLSHQLANLHTDANKKVFDCVVVVTDRQVLDRQLQGAIYQIEHAQGVVKTIDQDSKQLAKALVDGTSIVVTTLQKFPFVLKGLLHAAGETDIDAPSAEAVEQSRKWQQEIATRKYAVIVDEAHSSQSGDTAQEMKRILGVADLSESEEPTYEDALNAVANSRIRRDNLSMYAFTATPKGKTLQLFGVPGPGGKPRPFHLYSMRQAIEEGFILDVVQNFTHYDTYFKLAKKIADDPKIDKRRAAKKLIKFLHMHPTNVEQKTTVIVEHFKNHVLPKLGGRAKAMVVTGSRASVMQYKRSFDKYIKDNNYTNIRTLVAFSGAVPDPLTGDDVTESQINIDPVHGRSIAESQLPDFFAGPEFQILLVAEKYQTGFDQPLLQAMYVDKRLDDVQAVQTLSRLNRIYPGKEEPFVLDFVNKEADIYNAFKPYYDAVTLQEESEPSQLAALKHELDAMQVYYESEVESFAEVFYKPLLKQKKADHAALYRFLAPAKDRFKALQHDEERLRFRDRLNAYVRLYNFLSQIIPYVDLDLEKLFSFGRALLPLLPKDGQPGPVNIDNDVVLEYYRLERQKTTKIILATGDMQPVKSPTAVGTGENKNEEVPLSELISHLNEKYGTEFTDEERLFFEQVQAKALNTNEIVQLGMVNIFDKFLLAFKPHVQNLFIDLMQQNDGLVTKYLDDRDFGSDVLHGLAKSVYGEIQKRKPVTVESDRL